MLLPWIHENSGMLPRIDAYDEDGNSCLLGAKMMPVSANLDWIDAWR